VDDAVTRLQVDTRVSAARRLSGGNQQKLTIARWVATGFEVLLCFDPTRGIDVGTKRQIYALLRELAAQGSAVLLFTSELAEISLVCDRVIVLHQGRISDQFVGAEATEARLLRSAHGLVETEAVS
jgi:ribose transport system ATP-binding protein